MTKPMTALVIISLVVCLVFVGSLAEPSQQAIVGHHFEVHDIQGWSPQSVVIDSQGYIWFTDGLADDSVLQLNHEGKHISTLRTTPASAVATIALGGSDELLYLADNTNRRIVLVTTEKQQIASFPYTIPKDLDIFFIAVSTREIIYIIDGSPFSFQVWRMDANGSALPSIVADPPFKPACMALDPNNVLYVADRESSQIFQFASNGDQIGILVNPLIRYIAALTVDKHFNVYISAFDYELDPRVTKLSPDGNVIGSIEPFACVLAVDDGRDLLYLSDPSGHITKLTSDLRLMDNYHTNVPNSVTNCVVYDSNGGGVIAVNDINMTLMRFHANGTVKSILPLMLQGKLTPVSLAIGSANQLYLYAMDGQNNVVVQISDIGTVTTSLAFTGLSNFVVGSFAIGSEDRFYMSVVDCRCIIVYSRDGDEQRRIMPGLDPAKMFWLPSTIHVDVTNSSLYILDYTQIMLYQLSATDELIWSFNLSGHIRFPISFAVHPHGDIYVTDMVGNHFIRIMRSMGNAIVDYRFDDLTLFSPVIVLDSDDNVYLADRSRILILISKLPLGLSSTNHTVLIVLASAASFALIVVIGVGIFQFVCIKQSEEVKPEPCEQNYRHASRRARCGRRGAQVNFLHNYHDNLRRPVAEEDSADYVLYI